MQNHSCNSLLHVHVHPSAARSAVTGYTDGILQIKIAAPPVKGKANKELVTFLSQILGVARSAVSIEKGHTSRNKILAIAGLSKEETINRLMPWNLSSDDASTRRELRQ